MSSEADFTGFSNACFLLYYLVISDLTQGGRFSYTKTMNQDYKELVGYLDEKFGAVNTRLEELSTNFHQLQDAVDSYAKKSDGYFQEMLMLAKKVDRHERWLLQIAEKVGVKLDY